MDDVRNVSMSDDCLEEGLSSATVRQSASSVLSVSAIISSQAQPRTVS